MIYVNEVNRRNVRRLYAEFDLRAPEAGPSTMKCWASKAGSGAVTVTLKAVDEKDRLSTYMWCYDGDGYLRAFNLVRAPAAKCTDPSDGLCLPPDITAPLLDGFAEVPLDKIINGELPSLIET